MKKTFMLEELGCANCAAKMEQAVRKIEGVEDVSINFMRQSMVFQASDAQFDTALKKAQKAMKKIEPDVRVLV